MELVLKDVNRKDFLDGVDERKLEERKKGEGAVCNLTIYDPTSSPRYEEVADKIVLEKFEELKKTRKQEEDSEAIERKKFNNALTFTDIPATIKKAGFYSDGSPRVVVAGLFDKEVHLVRKGNKIEYHSSLRVELEGDVKIDKKEVPCFFAAIVLSIVSFCIPFITLNPLDFGVLPQSIFFGTIFGGIVPITLVLFYITYTTHTTGGFENIELSPGNCIKIKIDISTPVPSVPECVLEEICKHRNGPFAILFEVTEGWRKVKPDPVILRVINIDGQQFFEPVVGYDMTPLEKSSLTTA